MKSGLLLSLFISALLYCQPAQAQGGPSYQYCTMVIDHLYTILPIIYNEGLCVSTSIAVVSCPSLELSELLPTESCIAATGYTADGVPCDPVQGGCVFNTIDLPTPTPSEGGGGGSGTGTSTTGTSTTGGTTTGDSTTGGSNTGGSNTGSSNTGSSNTSGTDTTGTTTTSTGTDTTTTTTTGGESPTPTPEPTATPQATSSPGGGTPTPVPTDTPEPTPKPTPVPTPVPTPADQPPAIPPTPPGQTTDPNGQTTGTQTSIIMGVPKNSSPPCSTNSNANQGTTIGDPCNIANGTLWHTDRDFSLSTRTASTILKFERTYVTQAVAPVGDMGLNWRHNWETALYSESNSSRNIFWIDEYGGPWMYFANADGTFTSPPGVFTTLTEFIDHYEIRKPDGTRLIFSNGRAPHSPPVGKLTQLIDRYGETVNLTYGSNGLLQSISNVFAGTLTFTRDWSNRIASVTRVRDNLTYNYAYMSYGRLTSVIDFAGRTTSYTYTSNQPKTYAQGMLASITDPLGRTHGFTYYPNGQVYQQLEPGNAVRNFQYSGRVLTPVTQVTDINGQVTTYRYNNLLLLTEIDLPDGSKRFQNWNSLLQLSSSVDELGFITYYTYDAQGNLNSIQKPLDPSPVRLTYDPIFNILSSVTPLIGAATTSQVDPATGNILNIKQTGTNASLSLALGFDKFGNAISFNNGLANYANQTNTNGFLINKFDARNPESRTYDTKGRVTNRTFKTGRKLSYTWDNFDRLTRIDDSAGPSTVLTYDVGDRVISKTLTDGSTDQTTSYQWDERDRLLSMKDPLGNKTSYQYDLNGANGPIVIDQPISSTDAKGNSTEFQFDSRNRVIKKTDANGSNTQYGYNSRGDLILVTDALNQMTTFQFDGNDRLVKRMRPSVASSGSQNVSFIEVTSYNFDVGGRLLSEITNSAEAGVTLVKAYTYDDFNRLIRKTLQRIKNGKVLKTQDDSKYSYLPILEQSSLTEADNKIEKLSFNEEALPPFANLGYTVKATDKHNGLGIIEGIFNITPDPTGGVAGLADSKVTYLNKKYDPAGRLLEATGRLDNQASKIHDNLLDVVMSYDSFGRMSKLTTNTSLKKDLSFDTNNRILSLIWKQSDKHDTDTLTQESLSYDPTGLITANDHGKLKLTYSYDRTGQITETDAALSLVWRFFHQEIDKTLEFHRNFSYDLVGNRIDDSLTGAAHFKNDFLLSNKNSSFGADADGLGLLTTQVTKKMSMNEFSYRIDGKLREFTKLEEDSHDRDFDSRDPVKLQVVYFYDALGRRIVKKSGRSCRRFSKTFTQTYSYLGLEDRIVFAKDGGNNKSFYLDGNGIDEHLGAINRGHAQYFLTDHLGSVVNSQASGNLPIYGTFGETLGVKPIFNDDTNPVLYGFAGRQLDPESGTYYSRARNYNPETGKFMQKDPIGFAGENINLYGYTKNSPISNVDPFGLYGVVVPFPVWPFPVPIVVIPGAFPPNQTNTTLVAQLLALYSRASTLKDQQDALQDQLDNLHPPLTADSILKQLQIIDQQMNQIINEFLSLVSGSSNTQGENGRCML